MEKRINKLLMNLTIEQKLFWPTAIGAVFVIALLVICTVWYTGKIVEEASIKQGDMISALLSKKIAEEYTAVEEASYKLNEEVVEKANNPASLQESVYQFLTHQPALSGLTVDLIVNNNPIWFYAYKNGEKVVFVDSKDRSKIENYYVSSKAGWNSHFLNSLDPDLNRREIETYTSVLNRKGETSDLRGFICLNTIVDWNRNYTVKYLSNIASHGFYLSNSGEIFHITPPELQAKYVCNFLDAYKKALIYDSNFKAAIGRMKAGDDSIARVKDPVTGEQVWLSFSPVFEGWSFAVFLSDAEIQKQVRMIMLNIIVIGAIAFILLFFWMRIVARSIARPIQELDAASSIVASGDYSVEVPTFSGNDEISSLSNTLQKMVSTINSHVESEKTAAIAKERVDGQLRVAAEIQMNLLPTDYSQIIKLAKVDVFAYLKPAWEIGGDLYNFINIDDRHIFFLIGDVADKGVPAAIYMTRAYSFLKAFKDELYCPGEVLTRLNSLLVDGNHTFMFATAFCAVLDTDTGSLRYANAGHVHPVLITAEGKCSYIRPDKNCPIGFMAKREYNESVMQLNPGEAIFLYTDGVNEAHNSNRELLGYERLLSALEKYGTQDCKRVLFDMQQFIDEFVDGSEQSDDIAMLMVKLLKIK